MGNPRAIGIEEDPERESSEQDTTPDTEALLPEPESRKTTPPSASFWTKVGFVKDCVITFLSTASSNAILLTYLADLPDWYLGYSKLGLQISCPMALFFALCEAYAHLQQSNSIAAMEADHLTDDSGIKIADVPLTKTQIAVAIVHFCTDVLSDMSVPLLLMQGAAAAENKASQTSPENFGVVFNSPWVKKAVAVGALLFSGAGNVRDFQNTVTAARENNKREMLHEMHVSSTPKL